MTQIYYDLNLNWLVSGRGPMLNEQTGDTNFDQRLNYSRESLIDIIEEKEKTIQALQDALNTKQELLASQKELLKYR